MARPKRFELLTPRFVVWCSIQLSYGRVFREGHHGPDRPDGSESGSETSRKSALATRSGPDWQGPERGFWQSIWPGGSAEMAAKRCKTSKLRPRPLVADALQFHRAVRNRKPEGGTDGAFDQMDVAAMGADQFGGDRQSQAAATGPARGLERLEQMLARLGRHARAGVGHLDDRHRAFAPAGNTNLQSRRIA